MAYHLGISDLCVGGTVLPPASAGDVCVTRVLFIPLHRESHSAVCFLDHLRFRRHKVLVAILRARAAHLQIGFPPPDSNVAHFLLQIIVNAQRTLRCRIEQEE
jgi:hypothetical protein